MPSHLFTRGNFHTQPGGQPWGNIQQGLSHVEGPRVWSLRRTTWKDSVLISPAWTPGLQERKQGQPLGICAFQYLLISWFWFLSSWERSATPTAAKSVFICDSLDKPLLSILITFLSLIWFSLRPQIQFSSKLYQLLAKPKARSARCIPLRYQCSSNPRSPARHCRRTAPPRMQTRGQGFRSAPHPARDGAATPPRAPLKDKTHSDGRRSPEG